MGAIIWHNGNYVHEDDCHFPLTDAGLTLGLGVFDTALYENQKVVWAEEHFQRLQHDCKMVLCTECSLDFNEQQVIIQNIIQKNNIPATSKARIRTQITAGPMTKSFDTPSQPQTIIRVQEISDAPQDPIKAWIVPDYPRIAGCTLENCKRMDYTRNHCAMQIARRKGGNEAILTNTEGNIACATTSAVFIEEDNQLITPPLSAGILDSISRRKIIEEQGTKEEDITIERLKAADAVFLSNSIGIKTVVELEGKLLQSPSNLPLPTSP